MTIEDINKKYQEFKSYLDTAEQYEFPKLVIAHQLVERAYADLQVNWNDDHADLFCKLIHKVTGK